MFPSSSARPCLMTPAGPNHADGLAGMQRRKQLLKQLSHAPTTGLDAALDTLGDLPVPAKPSAIRHAIVVLGVPVKADGSLSEGLRLRIDRAAQVARQYPDAVVVPTGGAVANVYGEARAIEKALTRMGIDQDRILPENQARTTLDNAAFTFHLLDHLWPTTDARPLHLTVVAEPYHAMRALRLFAAAKDTFGMEATLHVAPSMHGPVPARAADDRTVYVGGMPLISDFQARLSRCIEEKRRIACGW